ncbi:DUF5801 repeats-in-toxin domain-containing protein [Allorhizobium sp. NPDC080224]|uniref:DUF5801 repeats-in-toxin domain-containing protein n=1 Tax=Allorhizobium sp. NPDC080224 TaxID=3390547 RepID=UPI003D0318D9
MDDAPEIDGTAAAITITVDEDDIDTPTSLGTSPDDGAGKDFSFTGPAGDGGAGPANATSVGTLAGLVKGGADEAVSFGFIDKATMRGYLEGLKLMSGEKPLGFDLDEAGKIVGFVNKQGNGQAVPGEDYNSGDDRLVFEFVLNPNGTFTFNLHDQLDHKGQTVGLSADKNSLTIDFGAVLQGTDKDGDSVTLTNLVKVNVTDDAPEIDGTAAAITITVDEDDIDTPTSLGTSPNDGAGKDFSFTGPAGDGGAGPANATSVGTLAGLVKGGADEAVSFGFIDKATMRGYLEGLKLMSGEKPLGFDLDEAGKIVGFVNKQGNGQAVPGEDYNSGDDRLVFEFVLNPNGTFTFKLHDQLDHKGPTVGLSPDKNSLKIDFGAVLQATDKDGDSVTLTNLVKVNVTDDAPEIAGTAAAITIAVDEDDINTPTSLGTSPNGGAGPANATSVGTLAGLVKGGADEAVSFGFVDTATMRTYLEGLKLMSGEKPLGFDLDEAGKIIGFVNKEGEPSPGQDYNSGPDRLVFEFILNPNGTFTFKLHDQLDHKGPTVGLSPDKNSLKIDFGAVLQATDKDGDSVTLTNLVKVNVTDDAPEIASTAAAISIAVDEDDINTSTSLGTSPNGGAGPANATSVGTLAGLVKGGADEAVSFGFVDTATMRTYLEGLKLMSGEKPLGFDLDEAGKIIGFVNKEGEPSPGQDYNSGPDRLVFEFILNPNGTFTFKLHDQLDHKGPTVGLSPDKNSLKIDFGAVLQATDKDGDSVTLTNLVKVNVTDDAPEIASTAAAGVVSEDGVKTATGSIGVKWGADDGATKDLTLAPSVVVKDQDGNAVNLKSNGEDVQVALVGALLIGYLGTTAPSAASDANVVFTVTVDKATGQYSFMLKQALDHAPPNLTSKTQYLDLLLISTES